MVMDKCSEVIREYYTKSETARLTHLSLFGGKYSIPDEQIYKFMRAYASYVDHNWFSERHSTYQYLTEILQDEFPFFVDLDIADEIGDEHETCTHDRCCKPATFGSGDTRICGDHAVDEMMSWVTLMCRQVKQCVSEPDVQLPTDEVVANTINALHFRNQLEPWECVVGRAPTRVITKQGVKYAKTGVHVIWPNMIVNKQTAKWIRALVTSALRGTCRSRDWENIVDVAVYQNSSSLRMIHSFKTLNCKPCARKEIKNQRAKLQTNRGILKTFLDGASGLTHKTKLADREVDEWAQKLANNQCAGIKKMERRAVLSATAIVKLKAELRCPCDGKGRKPDQEAGKYTVGMVVGPEGACNEDFQGVMAQDSLVAVYAMSVHRPQGTPLTPILLPAHAPAPISVEFEPASSDGEAGRPRVLKRGIPSPNHPSTYKKEDIPLSENARCALEEYFRGGVLGHEYSNMEVGKAYRVYYPKRKSKNIDTNQDGTPPYGVIVTTRGSRYCHVVGRSHSSSTIYFEFTQQRTCVQRCRSRKSDKCSKGGRQTTTVDYRIYAALFPYALRTVQVLPEEVEAWRKGDISQKFLRNQLSDPSLYMCVPREGPTFKVVLELARTQQARDERLRRAEMKAEEEPETERPKKRGRKAKTPVQEDMEESE
jgi:hypothetical protein